MSQLPISKPLKKKMDSLLRQYHEDNLNSLQMLIISTHDLLTKNDPSASRTTAETRMLVIPTSESASEVSNQKSLNEIFDEFEILLDEAVSDQNYLSTFEPIKEKLRDLFIHMEKQNSQLQRKINALECRVSALERLEKDDNVIRMGNIALQLRNKMVRFIKPNLSYRAARDEHVASLQTEERYQQLTNLIKMHDTDSSVSDLARQIRTLLNDRVSKAHDETPMSETDIDSVLREYGEQSDEYSAQAAKTVVRFLKLLSEYLKEPLIVSLE